jgi:hypothetical protein
MHAVLVMVTEARAIASGLEIEAPTLFHGQTRQVATRLTCILGCANKDTTATHADWLKQ